MQARAAIRHADLLREKVNLPIIPIPTTRAAALPLHTRYLEISRTLLRTGGGGHGKPKALASEPVRMGETLDHVDRDSGSDLSSATPIQRAIAILDAIGEVESGAGREEEEGNGEVDVGEGEDVFVDDVGVSETWAHERIETESNPRVHPHHRLLQLHPCCLRHRSRRASISHRTRTCSTH